MPGNRLKIAVHLVVNPLRDTTDDLSSTSPARVADDHSDATDDSSRGNAHALLTILACLGVMLILIVVFAVNRKSDDGGTSLPAASIFSPTARSNFTVAAQSTPLPPGFSSGVITPTQVAPTATIPPTRVPTPIPPTPKPRPVPGTVLYEANLTTGFADWQEGFGWKITGGMIVNDGSNSKDTNFLPAPVDLSIVPDYYVEAEIQFVRGDAFGCYRFGLLLRDHYTFGQGMRGSCDPDAVFIGVINGNRFAQKTFVPGSKWHVYRAEVKGTTIKFLIDGTVMLDTIDNRFLFGGKVGVWSSEAQVSVKLFRVVAQ